MKRLYILGPLALAGCATTPAGLAETRVERTIMSSKSAEEFAVCVAEHLPGGAELRSFAGKYWVLIEVFGTPRHRWDFTATENGSIAELRSTGLAGSEANKVQNCAAAAPS
jgi:hypothetical protein